MDSQTPAEATEASPIAERVLTAEGGGVVSIVLYAPEPDPASPGDANWRCAFRLTGCTLDVSQHGRGMDSLGAVVNAIQGVRRYIDESGLVLTWNGDEPGRHWVPYQVPQFFDLAFEREIIDEIDRRVAALGPKLTLAALRTLTQRIAEFAPRDEVVASLDALASGPGSDDRHVKEALQQTRAMLDTRPSRCD